MCLDPRTGQHNVVVIKGRLAQISGQRAASGGTYAASIRCGRLRSRKVASFHHQDLQRSSLTASYPTGAALEATCPTARCGMTQSGARPRHHHHNRPQDVVREVIEYRDEPHDGAAADRVGPQRHADGTSVPGRTAAAPRDDCGRGRPHRRAVSFPHLRVVQGQTIEERACEITVGSAQRAIRVI
jgi:hypothetical protein